MSTLAMIHTGPVVIGPLNQLASKILPGVKIMNFLDDTIVLEIEQSGSITSKIRRRVSWLGLCATEAGADVILLTCSSISMLSDPVSQFVGLPVYKIDEAMAEKAVMLGTRIGVIATLATTLDPTCSLIKDKSVAIGQEVQITRKLASEAFKQLRDGDPEGHDRLVLEAIKELSSNHDVIVLAQASMARLQDKIEPSQTPILTSPELGLIWTRKQMLSLGLLLE